MAIRDYSAIGPILKNDTPFLSVWFTNHLINTILNKALSKVHLCKCVLWDPYISTPALAAQVIFSVLFVCVLAGEHVVLGMSTHNDILACIHIRQVDTLLLLLQWEGGYTQMLRHFHCMYDFGQSMRRIQNEALRKSLY